MSGLKMRTRFFKPDSKPYMESVEFFVAGLLHFLFLCCLCNLLRHINCCLVVLLLLIVTCWNVGSCTVTKFYSSPNHIPLTVTVITLKKNIASLCRIHGLSPLFMSSPMAMCVFRTYALRRVRDAFREHQCVEDPKLLEQLFNKACENLAIIQRQVPFLPHYDKWNAHPVITFMLSENIILSLLNPAVISRGLAWLLWLLLLHYKHIDEQLPGSTCPLACSCLCPCAANDHWWSMFCVRNSIPYRSCILRSSGSAPVCQASSSL